MMRRSWLREAGVALIAWSLVASATGCGESGPELIPVSGKVTIDGKPAKEGGVVFHDGMKQFLGAIKADGSYSLMSATTREPGAPLGKYKATVFVTSTPKDADGKPTDLPTTISNKKYMNAGSTPLEVEVVESPAAGAYDLAVTK
jgi:predicted small lipoprotein YifL